MFLWVHLCILLTLDVGGILPAQGGAVPTPPFLDALRDGTSMYFVSSAKANFKAAQQICSNAGYKLASIESLVENEEIVERLRRAEVDEAWTSGRQVMDENSATFLWDSNGTPLNFENFHDEIDAVPYFPNQTYVTRDKDELKLYEDYSCKDDGDLTPEKCTVEDPKCYFTGKQSCTTKAGVCKVTEPECTVSDRKCETTPSVCTTTTKPCTLTPGSCTVGPPNCTTDGAEECTVEVRTCEAVQHPCKIIPGECIIVYSPACPTKPTCTTVQASCTTTSTSKPYDLLVRHRETLGPIICTPAKTSCTPPPRCDEAKKVCGPPTVSCPAPVIHCPEPCVTCPKPHVTCTTPEPKCEPPTIKCPPPEVVCTEQKTVCETPSINCTGPVVTCEEPCVECTAPEICCDTPKVDCPACRPQKPCITPPATTISPVAPTSPACAPCSKTTRATCKKGDCEACCTTVDGHKGLRHIKNVGHDCIAISKDYEYKWILEDCEAERNFICESKD